MNPVYLFLATGFEEIEAVTTLDVLRRAGIPAQSVSITRERSVTGSHGIALMADLLFEDIDVAQAELLILPGGMPGTNNLNAHDALKAALCAHDAAGKPLAAICAAPLILGQLGLLQSREATCYPGNEPHLHGAVLSEYMVVQDDRIVTASGPGVAAEFALQIVQMLLGEEKMETISESLLLS